MATAIVSGALANKPGNDGNAWTRLSWVRGLQRLGWQVAFVEQIQNCTQQQLDYFRAMLRPYRSCLLDESGRVLVGAPVDNVDLLFNISGHLQHTKARCRVYFDDDPGYTQIWQNGARLDGHDFYFTIGENIGDAGCLIPTGNIHWRHTRPPVTLKDWPVCPTGAVGFSTVASWRGAYAPIEYAGKRYGVKAHEFRKFIELPRRVGYPFEIALNIDAADQKDRDALLAHGWRLVDPPADFRGYIQNSGPEFSVAQGIYVETNSGWFSDRTVRYLASGKPAIVQETGFSQHLPVGEGLLSFRTMDEAVAGADAIICDYDRHCRAARLIAEQYFDSDKVIGQLLEEIGIVP
jgi:hypothetical protein